MRIESWVLILLHIVQIRQCAIPSKFILSNVVLNYLGPGCSECIPVGGREAMQGEPCSTYEWELGMCVRGLC